MPIQLTTPFDPGDVDPGKSYTHAKIVRMETDLDKACLNMFVKLGYMDSGSWVAGEVAPVQHLIKNKPAVTNFQGEELEAADPAFTTFTSQTPVNTTDSMYDQNAAKMYQWLIDEGHYTGTIV